MSIIYSKITQNYQDVEANQSTLSRGYILSRSRKAILLSTKLLYTKKFKQFIGKGSIHLQKWLNEVKQTKQTIGRSDSETIIIEAYIVQPKGMQNI